MIAEPLNDGLDVGRGSLASEEQGADLSARTGVAGERADGNLIERIGVERGGGFSGTHTEGIMR